MQKSYIPKNRYYIKFFSKDSCQYYIYILKIWNTKNKNATEIYKLLAPNLKNYQISQVKVNEILNLARLYIANYYKDKYIIEDISNEGDNKHFAADENEFLNIGNSNLWALGIINTHNKKFRLEITKIRNNEILAKFVYIHVKPKNIIVSDGWWGYTFLNNNNRGYDHHVHNHGHGDFGTGYDSTSYIEQL